MAATPALVNRQFNSPMKLYSPEVVADTLNKQTQILANGALGIDFHQIAAPGNLANSAVLRMLEEEAKSGKRENKCIELSKPRRRVLRFDWPPKPKDPDQDLNNNDNNDNNNNNDYTYNNVDQSVNNYSNNVYRANRQRHHFNTTTINICTSPGLKRIAWPPLPDSQTNIIERELVYPQEPAYNDSPLSPKAWAPTSVPELNSHQSPPAQQFPQEPVFQRIVQAPAPAFEPPPAFVTLRSSAPVRQVNAPVFESQPAATQGGLGPRMRGDQKWPPEANKAQADAENQARQALAKGPAVRPRAVKKDYSQFFAQNALTTTYPGYRAPPGTQHYVEEGTSNF